MKKILLPLLFFVFQSAFLNAQKTKTDFWSLVDAPTTQQQNPNPSADKPKIYKVFQLNALGLSTDLTNAPKVETKGPKEDNFVIDVPTPDGTFESFYIFENSVVAPEVAHLYTIKTYEGFAKDNPEVLIRCDISETGFHAVVYNGQKTYAVEPLFRDNNAIHQVFYKNDPRNRAPVKCGVTDHDHALEDYEGLTSSAPSTLRTYRLAYVASGEYSVQFGGSPYSSTNVLNSFASAVNLINPIFKRDLGILYTLVSTAALVFPNPATDPFDLSNQSQLIIDNHTQLNSLLGNSNFDVGHLLVWSNTGGLASNGVCDTDYKGRGFSGSNSSFTSIIIDYSCHEIGHQFGGSHNFSSSECGTSEPGFRFEPGEGSSIMSYAGVCGAAASYQSASNQSFHSTSINAMNTYIATYATCATNSTPGSGNAADPVVNAGSSFTIPKETPFVLVGSATDANDPSGLTYLWEQYDGGGAATTGSPNCANTNQPNFKYIDPSLNSFRVMPEMSFVLSGNNNGATWEKLPCIARTMNFNLIARDNNTNWGRTGNAAIAVTVANTGPFNVVAPNGGEVTNANTTQTVTWTVNGTNAHCSDVDILISTDGGTTFSTLATAVTNNGSYDVTLPNVMTTTARILVQCSVGGTFKSASTFFDVSNSNFTINMVVPVELTSFTAEKNLRGTVDLNWITASETDNSHFEVEKSRDGQSFTTIDRVNAAGNATQQVYYRSFDESPFNGDNYYRLKQVDFNGTFQYSQVINLNFTDKTGGINIFPNPGKDLLNISGVEAAKIREINIYNQIGQIVLFQNTPEETINISALVDGVYYVEVLTEDFKASKKLIVKK